MGEGRKMEEDININIDMNDDIKDMKEREEERKKKHVEKRRIKMNEMNEIDKFDYKSIPSKIPYIYIIDSRYERSHYMMIDRESKYSMIREVMSEWYGKKGKVNWKECQEEYSIEERNAREIRHEILSIDSVL